MFQFALPGVCCLAYIEQEYTSISNSQQRSNEWGHSTNYNVLLVGVHRRLVQQQLDITKTEPKQALTLVLADNIRNLGLIGTDD